MATEKEQVQEFLSIEGKSLHQYVESIDFDALSAAKSLFWTQRQRAVVCM